jgi:hypothetical protein
MAQACNPNYLEDRDQEDYGFKPARQEVCETPSQPMAGSSCVSLLSQLHRDSQIEEDHDPSQSYLKHNQCKKGWQAGSCLEQVPSKFKTQSSNPKKK